MRKLLPASALFVLGLSLPAAAQLLPLTFQVAGAPTPATAKAGSAPAKSAGPAPAPPGAPGGPEAGPGGQGGAKESPRLAKLKQLQFDRRPSAVLKAWAPAPKKDADKPGPTKDPKEEALEKELADFQRNVASGAWGKVKDYLASLPDEEAVAGYKQMLQSLQRTQGALPLHSGKDGEPDDMIQMMIRQMPAQQQFAERNAFAIDDLLGLAAAAPARANPKHFPARAAVAGPGAVAARAPKGLDDKEHLPALANVLREVIAGGSLPEVVVKRFEAEAGKPAGRSPLTRRQYAKLLTAAGQASYADKFLPNFEDAQKGQDLEALNLLSRHFMALMSEKEQKAGNLERAWHAVQAVLAFPDGSQEQKEEALVRAVELAPRVTETLGQEWLDESFTKKPERGMEILATVGGLVSQGLPTRPFQTDDRLNALKLMKTAVDALLKAAPQKAEEWRPTLTLLAAAWLREAEFSRQYDHSAGSGPRLRQDMYGNIFYSSGDDDDGRMPFMMMNQGNMPRPVPVADVLRQRPSDAWVAAVDPGLRPKLADVLARLHLKANEEDKAFPLIEQLAPAQPDEAKSLVREFIRVWTLNHDPNANRNRYRYSWFFYGFETRAESIPLTRSKQERNLQELAGWVARIKKLPGRAGELDDEQVVKAFTACHSSAEVYKTEAIEQVFGPLGSLKPRTLAGLAQTMRQNLAGLWRLPSEQEKNKTKRKKKDIEAEVTRGYEVARQTVEDGLKKFPDHWALLAAKASLIHDEINYRQELAKTSDFSAKRGEAFALYKKAADQYARVVKSLREDEQTNQVYELWFYASLGAVDLGGITEDKQPAPKEPAKIRAAILALPGELAEKHMTRFANDLFTRMSGAKPHVKFNYLKAGFEIVGDHPRAAEAKKVFDYYKDLVREIKLEAKVDGPPAVGSGKPFGVFVNIVHTRDIERESGGFGRYLQNQNSSGYFSYNYGRPTADYKDRFEQAAKEALKEHFEVVSVTFQDEKVHSRALPEFGWRYTPYAYLLLKPRGPHVDAIPPLRLDFDFLDTSGYAVLPVESAKVPIDCDPARRQPRPVAKLSVTQTLDERQANKGVLILEIKATGLGLMPDLEELCDLHPDGFEVAKTEDQGLGVKKFEEDVDQNAIVSERVWTITLKGQEGQAELPKTFTFAAVKLPTKEKDGLVYQRYNDADLQAVEQVVSLEQKYGTESSRWVWYLAGGLVILGGLGAVLVWLIVRGRKPVATGVALPADLNAFTVLELLQQLRASDKLTPPQRQELDSAIAGIERYYFSADRNGDPPPDLRGIATRWATAAQ
jgi:hypothetical protein